MENLVLIDPYIFSSKLFYEAVNPKTLATQIDLLSNSFIFTENSLVDIIAAAAAASVTSVTSFNRLAIVTDDSYINHPNLNASYKPFFGSRHLCWFIKSDLVSGKEGNNATSSNFILGQTYSKPLLSLIRLINHYHIKKVDFLACSSLKNPQWRRFFKILAEETGAIIGASSNETGNLNFGGDWIMETTGEDIERIYFTPSKLTNYHQTLATTLIIDTNMDLYRADFEGFNWPVTILNSSATGGNGDGRNLVDPVSITQWEDFIFTSPAQYFIFGSSNIRFNGNYYGMIIDNNTISQGTGTPHPGIFQSGNANSDPPNIVTNITLQSITVSNNLSGIPIPNYEAYLVQKYFGIGAGDSHLISGCQSLHSKLLHDFCFATCDSCTSVVAPLYPRLCTYNAVDPDHSVSEALIQEEIDVLSKFSTPSKILAKNCSVVSNIGSRTQIPYINVAAAGDPTTVMIELGEGGIFPPLWGIGASSPLLSTKLSGQPTHFEAHGCACSNLDISGQGSGGIIGSIYRCHDISIKIQSCEGRFVNLNGNFGGGMCGSLNNNRNVAINIEGCYLNGDINGNDAGGMIGHPYLVDTNYPSNSKPEIENDDRRTGNSGSVVIDGCYYDGNINGLRSGGLY